jgi:hypothetical protein
MQNLFAARNYKQKTFASLRRTLVFVKSCSDRGDAVLHGGEGHDLCERETAAHRSLVIVAVLVARCRQRGSYGINNACGGGGHLVGFFFFFFFDFRT